MVVRADSRKCRRLVEVSRAGVREVSRAVVEVGGRRLHRLVEASRVEAVVVLAIEVSRPAKIVVHIPVVAAPDRVQIAG